MPSPMEIPTPAPTPMETSVPVVEDWGTSVVEFQSQEVEWLTPSKVVNVPRRVKKLAGKIKSPFVVTTDTRDQLRNTLPHSTSFDPKRPVAQVLMDNFDKYIQSDEDEPRDMDICEIKKDFFRDLLDPKGWLTDTVIGYFITHLNLNIMLTYFLNYHTNVITIITACKRNYHADACALSKVSYIIQRQGGHYGFLFLGKRDN